MVSDRGVTFHQAADLRDLTQAGPGTQLPVPRIDIVVDRRLNGLLAAAVGELETRIRQEEVDLVLIVVQVPGADDDRVEAGAHLTAKAQAIVMRRSECLNPIHGPEPIEQKVHEVRDIVEQPFVVAHEDLCRRAGERFA